MNGWIISFLSDSAQNTTENVDYKDDYCSLSWSPYDRICIEKAETFEKLCTASSVVKELRDWPGSERTMHIIPDPKNTHKDIWELSESKQKIIDNEYSFYCIVTLRYSNMISCLKNNAGYMEKSDDIRSKMYKALDNFISANAVECDYRGFLPLSVEDVVVVFCADDLATINKCIKFLKTLKIKCDNKDYLFYSISNFSGLNDLDTDKDPGMNAIVKLNLYPYKNENEIIGFLKPEGITEEEIKVRSSCLFIELDHNKHNIISFYRQKIGSFNGDSDFYKAYVKSSRTYWIEEKTDESSSPFYYVTLDVTVENCSSDDKKIDKGHYPKGNIAAFIASEFDRILKTPRFEAWVPILKNQRDIFIEMANSYENDQRYQDLCNLINFTQNSLSIINQACSPAYEIPYYNNFYSGSHNDLLKMYYGLISAIFSLGFSMTHKKNGAQHPIYFAVNFESTISIHSTMFTMNRSNKRFVIFFLPSDNLYNYPQMIPNLIHEVFHYIAPYDREKRAENIIKIIVIRILVESVFCSFENFEAFSEEKKEVLKQYFLFEDFIERILSDTKHFIHSVEECFFKETYSYIAEKYFVSFDSFSEVYRFVYRKARDLIREEYNNGNLLKSKKYKSEVYKDKTIGEIFPGSSLKLHIADKKNDKEYEKEFFSDGFSREISDFMQDIIMDTKEVFCDICIASILNIHAEDYIRIYYDNLAYKFNRNELTEILKTGTYDDKNTNLSSTDLRLLMLMLFFIEKDEKDINEDKISYWLTKKLEKVLSHIKNKDDKELFVLFKNRLKNIIVETYGSYFIYTDIMREITCFDTVVNSFDDDSVKELRKNMNSAYRDDVKSDINIDSINYFTHFYYDTSKVCESTVCSLTKLVIYSAAGNQFYNTVSSVSEYVNLVLNILKKENFRFFNPWFRGVCHSEFQVTPSLFRVADPNLSLYANQANIIKYAYEKTLYFDNLWKTSIRDQMCFLQHYGMSTNLLDFSLDMLVALHFALNPDGAEDKEKVTSGDFNPIVYIFDPIEYTSAIIVLKENQINNDNIFFNGASNISPIEHTLGNVKLDKYFVTDMSIGKMSEHTIEYNKPYVPNERGDDYPIPIIVPQSNERIHIQNGTFLAYSLNSQPSQFEGTGINRYDYLSLQSIQSRYSALLSRLNFEERRFLYHIFINPNSVDKIRKELKAMNITKGRLYPEFSTIFREGMDEYRSKIQK